jgi:hypothetical protein
MTLVFFKLAFKTLKQCKRIGCATRKSREYFVVVKSSNLSGARFCNYRAQGDLAIAPKRDLRSPPGGKYRSTVKFWH